MLLRFSLLGLLVLHVVDGDLLGLVKKFRDRARDHHDDHDDDNDDNQKQEFEVYWNVPTFMCHKYDMKFEEVSKEYKIRQNDKDEFRGNQIAILYDPGMFPALLTDKDGNVVTRNGGIPQKGDLNRHLELFAEHLKKQIPDEKFDGIGVIDFESWRPVFRQNWGSLQLYKDQSIFFVEMEHPDWLNSDVDREAAARFEKAGVAFVNKTLKLAKKLRPKAKWGYYGYPYCYNLTPGQPGASCDPKTMKENDEMSWLFKEEDVLLPSVYIRQELSEKKRVGLVKGRVQEAARVSKKLNPKAKILAYHWPKYQDKREKFLTRSDFRNTMHAISKSGADGVIMWGSSEDVNSKEKCQELQEYLKEVMGPTVRHFIRGNNTEKSNHDTQKSNDDTLAAFKRLRNVDWASLWHA